MFNIHIDSIVAVIAAYLIGSISSAIITCKILHLPDPRSQGSGNPGATNVLRFGGKKAAIITLLGDALKGVIPVLLAKAYGFDPTTIALVAFAAFIGHLYPIFFRFEGGKGVATAFGCVIALSWAAGLTLLCIWLAFAFIFRYSSLAAIAAAVAAPIALWFFTNDTYALALCVMSILLIYRHAQNIKNLFAGKEKKIGR